jgi:hypothetical protein
VLVISTLQKSLASSTHAPNRLCHAGPLEAPGCRRPAAAGLRPRLIGSLRAAFVSLPCHPKPPRENERFNIFSLGLIINSNTRSEAVSRQQQKRRAFSLVVAPPASAGSRARPAARGRTEEVGAFAGEGPPISCGVLRGVDLAGLAGSPAISGVSGVIFWFPWWWRLGAWSGATRR